MERQGLPYKREELPFAVSLIRIFEAKDSNVRTGRAPNMEYRAPQGWDPWLCSKIQGDPSALFTESASLSGGVHSFTSTCKDVNDLGMH